MYPGKRPESLTTLHIANIEDGHVAGWTTAPVRFALLLVEARAILEVWIRSSSNRRRSTLSLHDIKASRKQRYQQANKIS